MNEGGITPTAALGHDARAAVAPVQSRVDSLLPLIACDVGAQAERDRRLCVARRTHPTRARRQRQADHRLAVFRHMKAGNPGILFPRVRPG